MSGREWKPGDVAVVRNEHGVWNRAICTVGLNGDTWRFGVALSEQPVDGSEAHPLVVLDPEDPEQVEALGAAMDALGINEHGLSVKGFPKDWREAFLDSLTGSLRSLIAPPKPEEPTGLGAVVAAADGTRWVKWSTEARADRVWKHENEGGNYQTYANIAAVKVLSEGVAS